MPRVGEQDDWENWTRWRMRPGRIQVFMGGLGDKTHDGSGYSRRLSLKSLWILFKVSPFPLKTFICMQNILCMDECF